MEQAYYGYRLVPVYLRVDLTLARQIIALWVRNGAIDDPVEIKRRLTDVAYVVVAPNGGMMGGSLVYLQNLTGNAPCYFYRMFIQPNHRRPQMMARLTVATRDYLQRLALDNGARGVVIVTENRKLMREGMRRLLARIGFRYPGLSPQGVDMWRADFPLPAAGTRA